MARATRKQIEAAYAEGEKAARAGDPSTPAPFDDAERGRAWMAGYDSVNPEERGQQEEKDWPL